MIAGAAGDDPARARPRHSHNQRTSLRVRGIMDPQQVRPAARSDDIERFRTESGKTLHGLGEIKSKLIAKSQRDQQCNCHAYGPRCSRLCGLNSY